MAKKKKIKVTAGMLALNAPPTHGGYALECGSDGLRLHYKMRLPFCENLIGAMRWFRELTGEYEIIGLVKDLEIIDMPFELKDTHLLIREKPKN